MQTSPGYKTVRIPIKPHLKKFLLKTYQCSEPMKIEEDSLLGKYCMSLLIDKRTSKNTNDYEYKDLLEVTFSKAFVLRNPRANKLIRLNLHLEELFRNSLFTWIHACIDCGINPYNACKLFVEHYDFDEKEFKHDAAYRAWMRHKNNEYKRKKIRKEKALKDKAISEKQPTSDIKTDQPVT